VFCSFGVNLPVVIPIVLHGRGLFVFENHTGPLEESAGQSQSLRGVRGSGPCRGTIRR
jgi:hypothetical protein